MSAKKPQANRFAPKSKKVQAVKDAVEDAVEMIEMLPATKTLNTVFSNLGYWKYRWEHDQNAYSANKYNKQIEFVNELIKFLEEQKATYEDFKNSAFYPYQKKEEVQESQKE